MDGGAVIRWCVALLVVAAPLVAVGLPAPEQVHDHDDPIVDKSLGERLGVTGKPAEGQTVDERVRVVVELKEGASVPRDELRVERVFSRQGAQRLEGTVSLADVRALSRDPRITAIQIESRTVGESGRTAAGVRAIGADDLHVQGIRGDNVTVGIIDQGFRPSDPEIAGHVGAIRSFGGGDDRWIHGTAVASVVADTAPNASLHLAAVGPTTTADEYRQAVAWLRDSGADVIVDSGSYFGQPGDGTGDLSRIAENASEDVVFVSAAGNYARRHWAGTHEADAADWVAVGEDEGNALGDGSISGRVSVGLRWEGANDSDFDLYLMRSQPGADAVVAHSKTRQDGADDRSEYLDATVPRGHYYVAVRAVEANGTTDLELYASHDLGVHTATGSLTSPGTAPGVLTVGASENGTVEPYSARGPVGDRLGVDVVAPDRVAATAVTDGEGTSYAAPYVAGVVALLEGAYPELTPAQHRTIVRSTAVDVGQPGPDVAAGYGRVDARSAYFVAVERSRYGPIERES